MNNDNFFSNLTKKEISTLILIKKATIIYKRNLRQKSRRKIRLLNRKIKKNLIVE